MANAGESTMYLPTMQVYSLLIYDEQFTTTTHPKIRKYFVCKIKSFSVQSTPFSVNNNVASQRVGE